MSKEYNEEVRLQSLKEFVDEYANEEELTSVDGVRSTIDIIEEQLNNYKKLLNSNPSEALEGLEQLAEMADKCWVSCDVHKWKTTIKQALLKAQENARSEEILQKYYQEGITLDSVMALKKENAELRQKAQEPKHYLKWEDLEFDSEWKCKAVKLNGTKYKIKYKCDFDFFNNYYQEVVIYSDDDRTVFAKLRDKKQFFNDLHLERVEE